MSQGSLHLEADDIIYGAIRPYLSRGSQVNANSTDSQGRFDWILMDTLGGRTGILHDGRSITYVPNHHDLASKIFLLCH